VSRVLKTLLPLILLMAGLRGQAAQDAAGVPTPEQLAARERIRPQVEAIFREIREPWEPGQDHSHYFADVTDRLIAFGPDVVPFLVGEIDLMDAQSFHYCAYALGRLGGDEAEAALRKAVRRSEERGGRYGEACKRYAVLGLALMGKPDVVDLVQDRLPIAGLEQFSELSLMALVASLAAPGDLPLLVKQLDTYAAAAAASPDAAPGEAPTAARKLRWALVGLSRVGDASLAPKVVPLLASPAVDVRAAAMDFLSRFGPPGICAKFIPHLEDANGWAEMEMGKTIERMKPRACYDRFVARLEVESDPEVRGTLFRTIAAIGGVGSLEVLRTTFEKGVPEERREVIDAVGWIGSAEGLNLVRAGLNEKNVDTALTSIEALRWIGGPGGTDTLLALVSDPRRVVSLTAVRALMALGDRRAGPRVAERLLGIVREPVGDLTLRPAVAELTDALVTFEFADPADDLKAAAGVQSDPEIRERLSACARLLALMTTNGNEVAAWITSLADPDAAVRALAARRLAEIESGESVKALTSRFDDANVTDADRAAILRAIADGKSRLGEALVERALADPAFDAWKRQAVRDEAAWAARRIGGDRMVHALEASASRRDGQDWSTLVYLALADPSKAAGTLRRLRVARLRYTDPRSGHEDADLDEILGDLDAGVAPRAYDVSPELLAEL
jgi:HEAT repeats/PBS lyase HEAT-like repeat